MVVCVVVVTMLRPRLDSRKQRLPRTLRDSKYRKCALRGAVASTTVLKPRRKTKTQTSQTTNASLVTDSRVGCTGVKLDGTQLQRSGHHSHGAAILTHVFWKTLSTSLSMQTQM